MRNEADTRPFCSGSHRPYVRRRIRQRERCVPPPRALLASGRVVARLRLTRTLRHCARAWRPAAARAWSGVELGAGRWRREGGREARTHRARRAIYSRAGVVPCCPRPPDDAAMMTGMMVGGMMDGHDGCYDGGFDGGMDGGFDGGFDGGCDGGFDGARRPSAASRAMYRVRTVHLPPPCRAARLA